MPDTRQLESVIWSIADGRVDDDLVALLFADEEASMVVIDRLIFDTNEDIAAVRGLRGEERDQVLADFTEQLRALKAVAARIRPDEEPEAVEVDEEFDDLVVEELPPGEVRLQATWQTGRVVVWAGGRGCAPEPAEALSDRLESMAARPTDGRSIAVSRSRAGPRPMHCRSRCATPSAGWRPSVGVARERTARSRVSARVWCGWAVPHSRVCASCRAAPWSLP